MFLREPGSGLYSLSEQIEGSCLFFDCLCVLFRSFCGISLGLKQCFIRVSRPFSNFHAFHGDFIIFFLRLGLLLGCVAFFGYRAGQLFIGVLSFADYLRGL